MRSICIAYLIFINTLAHHAQQPHFRSHHFDRISSESIEAFVQDRQGFIWLGAGSNLYRYDGLSFSHYAVHDSVANRITSLHQDDNNEFWVGLENGDIYLGNPKKTMRKWEVGKDLPSMQITGILSDQQEKIWISTYGEGIYVYDGKHLYNMNEEDGLLDDEIYSMAVDHKGKIWVGSDSGCNIVQFDNGEKSIKSITKAQGLQDEIVYVLKPSDQGMWIGFQSDGVCHYNTIDEKIDFSTEDWQYGSVISLSEITPHEAWVGTMDAGLIQLKKESAPIAIRFEEENSNKFEILEQDQEGNIWAVSSLHDIWSTSPQIRVFHHNEGDVQSVLRDKKGRLWVGTQHGLYNLHNGALEPFKNITSNVLSLFEDSGANLWVGTFGDGLICINSERNSLFAITEKEGLSNGSILSIEGYENHIWLGTLGGVNEIVIRSPEIPRANNLIIKKFDRSGGIDADFIYRVYRDDNGVIWIGTDGKGVVRMDNHSVMNLFEQEVLPVRTVYGFTELQNELWMAAPGDGIYKFDGSTHKKYSLDQGLTSLNMSSIAVDANNRILAVHDDGIDILDPHNDVVTYLGYNEGLDNLKPPLGSIYADEESGIWIGGQDLIAYYQPRQAGFKKYPEVVLDDIRIFDKSIDLAETEFPHRNNFISFHFTAIWLANPADISYRYMLEGYDMQWKSTGDHMISYSRLSPGNYTLKVQSELRGLPVERSQAEYRFTILKPIWQRDWFVGLAAILAVCLFYLYKKRIEKNISREAAIQKERIESQYEVLKAQINPHFLFNSFNTLANLIEEDSNLAIEYIEKLSDYYRSIMQLRDQKVISLREEIELIDDFGYLLKKRFGENIVIEKQINGLTGFVPPLTIQMLVENAVKHNIISKRKPLHIRISTKDNEYLCVENNFQPKMTRQESTNFGLQSIKTRYELLSNKPVDVLQTSQAFTVTIPIIRKIIK
ncbi:MAG: histidine kinase [Saprospiraceae bacterium]|nr:histidine kinase [Saprospiraceae bacterium]